MKNVVITGATRGIGRGLAQEFLARGARVLITGRSQASVDEAVEALAARWGQQQVRGVVCNLAEPETIHTVWQTAVAEFARVDIWINNAGMSIERQPLAEQRAADIAQIVSVNLAGLLIANQVALNGMLAQGHGQIWNMEGFGSGGQKAPGMVAYGATKRAVNYVTSALQKEIKGTQVQVCALSPGIVVTDLLVGDYDLSSEAWHKARKILNILGDTVETVTPFLVEGVLKTHKSGSTVAWLTGRKAFWRFLTAAFNKRDLFAELEQAG